MSGTEQPPGRIPRGLRVLVWAQLPITVLAIALSMLVAFEIKPLIETDRSAEARNKVAEESLTQQIITSARQAGMRTVAVLDFTDLYGTADRFGRYLAERLIAEIAGAEPLRVVGRRELDAVRRRFGWEGADLVRPENVKRLRELQSTDAVVAGSMIELQASVEVTARLIATDSGAVVGVSRASFLKDRNVLALVGTPPPAVTPFISDLTGAWRGVYFYSQIDARPRPPVEFQATITSRAGVFGGRISEPNTFADAPVENLHAKILGGIARETGEVMFIKRYDGTGGVTHEVLYEGYLQRPGVIQGKWFMEPRWWGTFQMSRR